MYYFFFFFLIHTVSVYRDNLRLLLVDATLSSYKEDVPHQTLQEWVEDQRDLSTGMAEMAISQVQLHSTT